MSLDWISLSARRMDTGRSFDTWPMRANSRGEHSERQFTKRLVPPFRGPDRAARRVRPRLGSVFLMTPALSRRDPVRYEVRMIHKLMAVAAWMMLAFVAYATISSIRLRPTLFAWPKFERARCVCGSRRALLLSLSSAFCSCLLGRSWERSAP